MAKRKHKQVQPPEQGFVRRTYEGGKNVLVKHWMTSLVALLVSSVVPMLEQWHTDKQYQDQIEGVASSAQNERKELEARTNKQIDDLKKDENDRIKAIWETLRNQKYDSPRIDEK